MAKHQNHGSKKLITSPEENTPLPSVDKVFSNDPLLAEILLRIPVISIHMLKVVCKSWLSLIISPYFTLRRSKIPNIDSPSGLLLPHSQGYKFTPLDARIQIPSNGSQLHTTVFDFGKNPNTVKIVQSCNGLLLCYCIASTFYYVYNPFTKLSKKLVQLSANTARSYWRQYGGMQMAYDPTKSPHYKVVHADHLVKDEGRNYQLHIKTYSSRTHNWENWDVQFPYPSCSKFEDGVYWNGSINWLNDDDVTMQRLHFELDNQDRPILTEIQTPQNLQGKLFESRGRLLFIDMVNNDWQKIIIFEMNKWNDGWSQKYLINVKGIIKQCPNSWKIPFNWVCRSHPSIVLGEKEDEVFLLMELNGRVAQYNVVTESIRQICYSRVSPSDSFLLIASFAPV